MQTPNPIILALDVPDQQTALQWVKQTQSQVGMYKIGMQLFYQEGPNVVRAIRDAGGEVFLDLKLHDIPHTVARACDSVLSLGARLLTVHTSGGREMLQAAQSVVAGSSLNLLGVTALTSLDSQAIGEVYPGMNQTAAQWGVCLAGLAAQTGLYGIVCSAQENAQMRGAYGPNLALVNPGIRPVGSDVGDQKRVVTPGQAMASGATYLVVGRPILNAPDPQAVLAALNQEISQEIADALRVSP